MSESYVSYKYRIYPTLIQIVQIIKTLGCVRYVWNFFLSMRRGCYLMYGKGPSHNLSCSELTKLKHEEGFEWLQEVDSTALQSSLENLNDAYQNFFRGNTGFPKFKSRKSHRDSYTSKNNNNSIHFSENRRYIRLPKLGDVRVHVSRPIHGRIISATVSRTPSGKYYVSVLCLQETPVLKKSKNVEFSDATGIDLGEKYLAVLPDGETLFNPSALEQSLKKLALEQKRLSRKTRGGRSYERQRLKVAKIHERIANIRRDNLQKMSTYLMRNYFLIGTENLDIRSMLVNAISPDSARRIADVSWGEFQGMLKYKASWYRRVVIKVDRYFPSSQKCSSCGTLNPAVKDLSVREWTCPECGTHHDRDVNAAINIQNESLRIWTDMLSKVFDSDY